MGFLIDAVATWFGFAKSLDFKRSDDDRTQNDYLAELNHHTEYKLMQCFSSAVIGGVDSQA